MQQREQQQQQRRQVKPHVCLLKLLALGSAALQEAHQVVVHVLEDHVDGAQLLVALRGCELFVSRGLLVSWVGGQPQPLHLKGQRPAGSWGALCQPSSTHASRAGLGQQHT